MKKSRLLLVIVVVAALLMGLPAPSARAEAVNPTTTNILSYWSLDETSGTRDDADSTRDLTDRNTVLYGTGKISNAADFENSNYEILDYSPGFGTATDGDFSVSFWINPESNGEASYGSILISSYRASSTNGDWAILQKGTSIRLFRRGATNYAWATATSTVATGSWYHVVIVYKSSDASATCYINGSSVTFTRGTAAQEDWRINYVTLGGYSTTASTYNYDGLLDEVGVWDDQLTADETTWLYNSGNGRSYADIAASATATPTATATATETFTPTQTFTVTQTFTFTPTASLTFTPTETFTPTVTATGPTPTYTETHTPTLTPLVSPSSTPNETEIYLQWSAVARDNYPTTVILSVICGLLILAGMVALALTFVRRQK